MEITENIYSLPNFKNERSFDHQIQRNSMIWHKKFQSEIDTEFQTSQEKSLKKNRFNKN